MHYTVEDWADFTRNSAPAGRQLAMQRHLDEGCADCADSCRTWQAFQAVVASDAQYEPPASAVRLAQAIYVIPKPAGYVKRAFETARLIFDSRLAPLPAGVRALASGRRKYLYAGNEFLVDLQVDASSRTHTVVVGQV